MHADKNILHFKHEILYHVAKMAFEGTLDKERDLLPYRLVKGPKPNFYCCIYKEREIVRQRIRLAEGKAPGASDDGNIIQVITAACEDCPISSYTVTDNCQNCPGKACINACKFGAISTGDHHSRIDPSKCKECGMCAKACPYNAIAHLKRPCKFSCPVDAITYDEYGISVIDNNKCIKCGLCLHKCPFGAIGAKTFIVQVIEQIKSGRPVYAMVAPAAEGQFGPDITMASWRQAMKKLGFTDMYEVASGADMTTMSEAEEWSEAYAAGEKKTTSCCPAFVNMINNHFPELSDRISTTVSPMCMTSRMIKAKHPDAYTVFIGPCTAKKSEVIDQKIEGNADAVLAFSELRAIMRAREVAFEPVEEVSQEASVFGKRYGNAGGVTAAIMEYMKEKGLDCNPSICKANGASECKKALLLLKNNRLPEDFIEGMACEGGCVGGPSSYKDQLLSKRDRDTMISSADRRTIIENLNNYDMNSISLHK